MEATGQSGEGSPWSGAPVVIVVASTVHTHYHPSGGPLYLWCVRCTTHCGGININLLFTSLKMEAGHFVFQSNLDLTFLEY